ncbi:hypothetical protein RR46_14515 [Papilio xuthus]|uniref:Uncharacterized protein n=1 Tax=Papilio xuthus TaxID=66420 RepID=A0A194PCJ9_PAPXU|nr:hypothetical protein RR46_14515 [Papilio xuthus]
MSAAFHRARDNCRYDNLSAFAARGKSITSQSNRGKPLGAAADDATPTCELAERCHAHTGHLQL